MMFNSSGFVGQLISGLTYSVTGSIYLTLLTLMMFILAFMWAIKIPLEVSLILVVPLLIGFIAEFGGDWKAISGIIMLYLAIVFAKYFIK